MFRFLLILGLAVYIVYKISSFFFRAGAASQQIRNAQKPGPFANPSQPKAKKSAQKDGEYIDYEEVK